MWKFISFIFILSCAPLKQNSVDVDLDPVLTTDNSFCYGKDADTNSYDYGPRYAPGPYGFKGHVCWLNEDLLEYEFVSTADTIHNICLFDSQQMNHCLIDYYKYKKYDYIILNISDCGCYPCRMAAKDQRQFMEYFKKNNYNVFWITILDEALAEEVLDWDDEYKIDGMVLSDPGSFWSSKFYRDAWPQELRGVPTFFVIRTSDMKVWFSMIGWPLDETRVQAWQEQFGIMIDYVKGKLGE